MSEQLRQEFEAKILQRLQAGGLSHLKKEILARNHRDDYTYSGLEDRWKGYRDGYESGRASLSLLERREQPQPIETAPKDGSQVQVWLTIRNRWVNARHLDGDIWEGEGYRFSQKDLSHWQNTPPPPGTEVAHQVCPNCEEMRRLIIEGAKYAYIYSWGPSLDRIYGMEKAMKQAEEDSVTRPGLKNWETMLRPEMLAALSTLQVQVGGEQ